MTWINEKDKPYISFVRRASSDFHLDTLTQVGVFEAGTEELIVGVRGIVGTLPSTVPGQIIHDLHSLLFDKEFFSESEARDWVAQNLDRERAFNIQLQPIVSITPR